MGDIWLCTENKRTGIKPGFILTISSDNKLSVWDQSGRPVHFTDLERSEDRFEELSLDHYLDGGRGTDLLLDLFAAMTGDGERLCLRAGKGDPGIRHDFIMSIEFRQNLLAVWDKNGKIVPFTDRRQCEEHAALPLDRYTAGGRPGVRFLKLLAAMADCDLNHTTHSMTKIRCRCEVADMTLYRVVERKRFSHIYTPGKDRHSSLARPVIR